MWLAPGACLSAGVGPDHSGHSFREKTPSFGRKVSPWHGLPETPTLWESRNFRGLCVGTRVAQSLWRGAAAWGVGNETDNPDLREGRTMAKTQRRGQVMNRVARRVKTAGRAVAKASQPVRKVQRKVQVTLGDLIAAAFDVAGEAKAAARLVSSKSMAEATGRQIVLVGG